MDVHSKEQRSRNMRAIKNKDTKIELVIRSLLWKKGYRFRINSKSIFGKPDISIKKYKVAVFCDSEFWHGKNWDKQVKRISTNKSFWDDKIRRNIARDQEVNRYLADEGWIVLRFWGEEIKKQPETCVTKIIKAIEKRKKALQV